MLSVAGSLSNFCNVLSTRTDATASSEVGLEAAGSIGSELSLDVPVEDSVGISEDT